MKPLITKIALTIIVLLSSITVFGQYPTQAEFLKNKVRVGYDWVDTTKTLKEYADMLAGHGFLRPHQTHLVNTVYIKSWIRVDGGSLLLKDGTKVPISKLNRQKVRDLLAVQFKL